MPVLPNAKAEACAQLLAPGGISEAEAYSKAFGGSLKSAYSNATVAMGKHGIRERVKELQAAGAAKFMMIRAEWLESFRRIAGKAESAGDFAAAKGCLREIGLALPGWYAPDKVEVDAPSALGSLFARVSAFRGVLDENGEMVGE